MTGDIRVQAFAFLGRLLKVVCGVLEVVFREPEFLVQLLLE